MRININVKPRSGKQEIKKISETDYRVFLKSLPEENKANIELMKLLKKEFKKDIKIVSGKTSRKKVVEIKDGD
jgi:uncharacterized protein (TIGR00251 family)